MADKRRGEEDRKLSLAFNQISTPGLAKRKRVRRNIKHQG